jgi:hypothetical protein
MDEHIPRAISIGLRLRGVDLLTVQEDNTSGQSDSELLDRAAHLERALFTHDDDLLAEATNRQRAGHEFSGVIYAHHMKISIGKCVKDLEILSKYGTIEEIKNQVVFLPL